MNDFSFNPTPAPNETINIDFWGEITTDDFAAQMRIAGATIAPERIKSSLINAAIFIDDELLNKRAAWEVEGNANLAAVDSPQFDGVSKLVILWRIAVYSLAAAILIETHPDISATNDGLQYANGILPTADTLRAQSRAAVQKIKGGPTGIARLI